MQKDFTQSVEYIFFTLISLIVLRIACFFKVSFIIGSKIGFFSASDFVGPVMGAFGGPLFIFSLFGQRSLLSTAPLFAMVRHIPTLCGALYWQGNKFLIRFIIPVVCLSLFLLHPVGQQAWAYPLYWLIPVSLYLFNKQGVIADAFGSTFVVHSVGSVIWLYSVPMDVHMWWGLIPVVFVERCFAAIGMITIQYLCTIASRVSIHKIAWIKKA